jgi:hypothetical protein
MTHHPFAHRTQRRFALLVACLALAFSLAIPALADAAPEGMPCNPEPFATDVTYGDLVNCAINAIGDTDVFRFAGVSGESVTAHVAKLSGPGFMCLTISRPDGTALHAGCVQSLVTAKLNQTGTYSIRVLDFTNATVVYALALERVAPPSPTARSIEYGETLRDEINAIADTDLFFFQGLAGTTVSVAAAKLIGAGFPCFAIYRPDGTLFSPGSCMQVGVTQTLNQTGTYTIKVADLGNDQIVTYGVTLQCVSGTCPPRPQGERRVSCFSTHTSGTGTTFMKICLSVDGNLVNFESPAGFKHLEAGDFGEGYAVCSSAGTHGYDAGFAEGGFGPAIVMQPNGPNTFPLTIIRDTLDGIFRLQQQFSRDTTEKDVTITMTLTNLSAIARSSVHLTRYFDGDIDNSVNGDYYARVADSVSAWENSGHGLMLTALTFNVAHSAGVQTFATWNPLAEGGGGAKACGAGGTSPAFPGDFVGRVDYSLGTLAGSATRTVRVVYRRF